MDVDISYPGEDAAVVSVRGALDIDTASEEEIFEMLDAGEFGQG